MMNTLAMKPRLMMLVVALLVTFLGAMIYGIKPAQACCLPEQPTAPINDNFSAARALQWFQTYSGTTQLATIQTSEPRPYSPYKDCGRLGISNSVWYKITLAPSAYPQRMKFSTAGSKFDTVLTLYKGSSLTSLQQVDCSNNNSLPGYTDDMFTTVATGQTYYLQLSGTGGLRSGTYKLRFTDGCDDPRYYNLNDCLG